MKTKSISFDLFRYQILPKSRSFQPDLFGDITSLEDLLARKNEFFFAALKNVQEFQTRRSLIRHKVLFEDATCILYKFAANRSLTRETENFTEEEISNWPSFFVYVWNAPEKQIIAVQERWNAFQQTEIVAQAIVAAVDVVLGRHNLCAHVEAQFLENVFWDLVVDNVGKLRDIRFELITPNLSNISAVLSDELKDFAKKTNTAQTTLDIQADPDSTILVDPDDERLKGLVSYASEGRGNISLKIRGLSKRIHTKKSKRHIDISELEIEGKDPAKIVDIIKGLLS